MEKDPDLYTYDNGRTKGHKKLVYKEGEWKHEWQYD